MEIQRSRFAVIDFAEDLEALLLQRQPLIGNGPPAPLSAIPAHLVVKLLLVPFDDRRNTVAFVYDDSCFLTGHGAFSFSAYFFIKTGSFAHFFRFSAHFPRVLGAPGKAPQVKEPRGAWTRPAGRALSAPGPRKRRPSRP